MKTRCLAAAAPLTFLAQCEPGCGPVQPAIELSAVCYEPDGDQRWWVTNESDQDLRFLLLDQSSTQVPAFDSPSQYGDPNDLWANSSGPLLILNRVPPISSLRVVASDGSWVNPLDDPVAAPQTPCSDDNF